MRTRRCPVFTLAAALTCAAVLLPACATAPKSRRPVTGTAAASSGGKSRSAARGAPVPAGAAGGSGEIEKADANSRDPEAR